MDTSTTNEQLHAIFLPYMAPGHMMPLINIARLFAANNLKVTIITTPMNAQRFQNCINQDIKSAHQIQVKILHLPSLEAGLPKGCENLLDTPTPQTTIKLFKAINMLTPQIQNFIIQSKPNCIVSDILFHWTADIANELNIPRVAFSGSGFFNLCVAYSIENYQPHKNIESEFEPFRVPTLPDEVFLTRSQLPDIVKTRNDFSELFDKLKEAERKSFGMVVNSFYELESKYGDYYRNVVGRKAWHVGPVSLLNKTERGDKGKHGCLNWLDSKKANSVLYICFGSLTRFGKKQVTEIATAVENSGYFFIWVLGKILENDKDGEEWWLPDGYEDRIEKSGKGMIIKGWAPQVLILENSAIGGFLTHCGWNSIMEGVAGGVPMITWPIFAEQFYNEKLVTQVMRIGVPVGNELWKAWATEEGELIRREKIEEAMSKLMGGGEAVEEMRVAVRRLSEVANKAVKEGGSSYEDLELLINDISLYGRK